jgi:hypothetical protein
MRYNIGTKKAKKKQKNKENILKKKPLIYKGFSVFIFGCFVKKTIYFPMQKLANILPNNSSLVT